VKQTDFLGERPLTQKQKKCWNCKFRTEQFKVFNCTHTHCDHPSITSVEGITAWETLRAWYDSCEHWEEREKNEGRDTV